MAKNVRTSDQNRYEKTGQKIDKRTAITAHAVFWALIIVDGALILKGSAVGNYWTSIAVGLFAISYAFFFRRRRSS